MCVQCVANSVPYVGIAVGGLRAMSWNAKRSTLRARTASSASPDATSLDQPTGSQTGSGDRT